MCAIATSMPRTAPVKAAVADGIAMFAIPATMRPAARLHAQYRLESGLFRNESNLPGLGSEGAMVM
jgi:hypothetical protein